MITTNYTEMQISENIKKAVARMGFTELTEIQQKAIPVMLEGHDIIAKAPTGTGKTCAFGVPIIQKLDTTLESPQVLILSPTRELATQICAHLQRIAQFTPDVRILAVYGGDSIERQIINLKRKPQIIVATPGRLIDHMNRRTIRLDGVHTVVLDESDRMLDMGFVKDVRRILDRVSPERQIVMFSATISREVMDISWLYQKEAVELTVLPDEENEPKITQYGLESAGSRKIEDLIGIIKLKDYKRAIVFCNTKHMTDRLCLQLAARGFNADCIHGGLRQAIRNRIMAKFKAGGIDILVATDVAARGIDVSDVDAVFNYDMPLENSYYLHRIGRTGRAKKEGTSYIFFSTDEKARLNEIMKYTHSNILPFNLVKEQAAAGK